MPAQDFTREEKLNAIRREIALRRRVFPRRVEDGRMMQAEADREIALMEAIAADYAPPTLFDQSQQRGRSE